MADHGTMTKARKTPEQQRAADQAYAQREGYRIAYIATTMRLKGGVTTADQDRACVEAKARFPIFGLRRRIVEDEDHHYRLSEDGACVELQVKNPAVDPGPIREEHMRRIAEEIEAARGRWRRVVEVKLTSHVVRTCADLFAQPDEPFVTDE